MYLKYIQNVSKKVDRRHSDYLSFSCVSEIEMSGHLNRLSTLPLNNSIKTFQQSSDRTYSHLGRIIEKTVYDLQPPGNTTLFFFITIFQLHQQHKKKGGYITFHEFHSRVPGLKDIYLHKARNRDPAFSFRADITNDSDIFLEILDHTFCPSGLFTAQKYKRVIRTKPMPVFFYIRNSCDIFISCPLH